MGELSKEDSREIIIGGGSGLCFDCDPDSASTVPSLFWQWQPGDLFTIEDFVFCVTDSNPQCLFNVGFSHTRMSDSARSCLSSSTYLHTSSKKNGARREKGENVKCCFMCETGWMVLEDDGWHCDTCDTYLPEPQEFILPAWIVNQPPIGKTYGNGQAGCPDCDTVRTLGGVGYCSYHHALLVEQHEDGSLGYGNA